MQKYLFVCRANRNRSPWAADWFSKYCKERSIETKVKSAGLDVYYLPNENKSKFTQLTEELVNWADMILIMENYMKKEILKKCTQTRETEKKIINLDIPDVFYPLGGDEFGPKAFFKILEGRLKGILPK